VAEAGRTTLLHAEAAFLARYLKTLVDWDARASVRVQHTGRAMGVFGSPPTGCITFIALPLAVVGELNPPVADRTVSAGRLRDIVGDVSYDRGPIVMAMPDAVTGPAELAVLPPGAGWELVGNGGAAGELGAVVDESIAEFRRRVPTNTGAEISQRTAEEIWSKPGWSGLPVRTLHTARKLGFLSNADAPVKAAKAPGWTRLATPSGQVFTSDQIGNLSLNLIFD